MGKISALLFCAMNVCLLICFAQCPAAQAGWKDKLHNAVERAEGRIKREYSEVVTESVQPKHGENWTAAVESARAALASRNYDLAEQEYQKALSAATLSKDSVSLKLTLEKFASCCREHAVELRKSAFLSFIPFDWVLGGAIVVTLLPAGFLIWLMSQDSGDVSAVALILLLAAIFSGVWSGFQGWTHAADIARVEGWAAETETRLKALN